MPEEVKKEVSLEERLSNLKGQKTQIEQTYSKIMGAIEFCEALIEENNTKEKSKK